MDNNDTHGNGNENCDECIDRYEQGHKKSELWLMAMERQRHLEELEIKYLQLYEEGRADGFKLSIRIAVEGRYHEDVGVWLHELNASQMRSIVRVMLAVDDISVFRQIIEQIR